MTSKLRAAPNKAKIYSYRLTKNNFKYFQISKSKRNTNVKKHAETPPEFPFHTQIAAHFQNSDAARFAYDLPTPTDPAIALMTKARIDKIYIIIIMTKLINQSTIKRTLIAAKFFIARKT
jgi:hypothetical protein